MYGPTKYGLNRVAWNLRYDGPKKLNFLPPPEGLDDQDFFFDPSNGPNALPGTYKVAVTVNGKTETQTVDVQTDPRFKFDSEGMRAQLKLGLELRDEVSALHEALNRLNGLHKQITSLQELLVSDEGQEGQARPMLHINRYWMRRGRWTRKSRRSRNRSTTMTFNPAARTISTICNASRTVCKE